MTQHPWEVLASLLLGAETIDESNAFLVVALSKDLSLEKHVSSVSASCFHSFYEL